MASNQVLRSALRAGAGATGAAVLGGTGYGAYLYETDPGTRRMLEAYGTFVPVVLHYRWVEWRHKRSPLSDEEWEAMDRIYARPTVAKLADLQGMYCKYGQTSAGFTNTFGDAWIRELRKLEDKVPPRPAETVLKTIEEETGKPVGETFADFDPEPLGSASIGQVHKATLNDGRQVAVKVQYHEAEELFHEDIDTIRKFCMTFAPEQVVLMDALEKQNRVELDYLNEAQNLVDIAANMKKHGFMPREVYVPKPLPEYSTRRMLVMELLPGPKLIDGINAYFEKWAIEHGITLHDLEKEARRKIDKEGIPAKYDGPSAIQISLYRQWLQTKDVICNIGIGAYNHTFGKVSSKQMEYLHSVPPPNIPRIIDTLMRVHGHQLMVDGTFNADPHGGNFLLLPDGRIGLIDYGATKRLSRNERLSVCLLYAALARKDKEMLFALSERGGYKSKYGRKDVLYKLIQFGYDSYGKDVTGGKNIQQFVDELKEQDPWEEVPDNLVMAQFMSIRLRSLALGMNHPIKCSDWWGPIAEEQLKREGLPYESWDRDQMIKYTPELNMQKFKFG